MGKRIILDSNIWISIFLRKNSLQFLEFISDNEFILIADDNLRNELLNVISRKKFKDVFSAENIVDAMSYFDSLSNFITTKKNFPDVRML
ncbi:putative toxin-antitoxin system toxin component, PIN family [Kaistella palustris]|uniref:putative toxin-antitoxin system toxin component, PIN family n=1 Tax=Kaistella palustris TaxID=493376 RepID=UPI000A0751B1